jgi:SAM-dependent methyltransferase
VEGDSAFYAEMQKYPGYYMPWKWEHEKALSFLQEGMSVLEIGCGLGGFLRTTQDRLRLRMTGLELNSEAVQTCQKDGLNVFSEDLAEHAEANKGRYDAVCAFQVIEHVDAVKPFLNNAIKCLKPDGMLVLSVPNDDGFVGVSFDLLNAPPHHIGLYNTQVFEALPRFFGLELKTIAYEPLQSYHVGFVQRRCEHMFTHGRFVWKVAFRLLGLHYMLNKVVAGMSKWMIGHTMLAVYSKASTEMDDGVSERSLEM